MNGKGPTMLAAAALLALAACGPADPGNAEGRPPPTPDAPAPAAPAPSAPAPASAATAPDPAILGAAIAASIDGGVGADARLLVAAADLDGDGEDEALGYLIDPMFCGTGGCSLYLLDHQDGRWTVIDDIGPAQLPIYRLGRGSDGWYELGITIAGGGSPRALMALPHGPDGYADNPTVDPARPASADGATLLLPDDIDRAVPIGR